MHWLLISSNYALLQNAVGPDNIRVTGHFVPWLDPTAKLLSGTPVLTRARVTTTNQNKTREYLGLARFRRDGPLSQCGRRATGRYFLARCYPGLWRASSTPRGYTAGSWIVCAKVPPPQNSSLVNSKVSRISTHTPLFFFPPSEEEHPLPRSPYIRRVCTSERAGESSVLQTKCKTTVMKVNHLFRVNTARSKAFVVITVNFVPSNFFGFYFSCSNKY